MVLGCAEQSRLSRTTLRNTDGCTVPLLLTIRCSCVRCGAQCIVIYRELVFATEDGGMFKRKLGYQVASRGWCSCCTRKDAEHVHVSAEHESRTAGSYTTVFVCDTCRCRCRWSANA